MSDARELFFVIGGFWIAIMIIFIVVDAMVNAKIIPKWVLSLVFCIFIISMAVAVIGPQLVYL